MRRLLPVVAAIAVVLSGSSVSVGQTLPAGPVPARASLAVGRVDGVVVDEQGVTLDGVAIVALGTALAMVQTGPGGRFSLALPPGQYVLRATRAGYVSTYREAVRVQSEVALRRSITLVRASVEGLTQSHAADALIEPSPVEATGDHGHSDTAWRLRHLPRTVLRERSTALSGGDAGMLEDPVAEWQAATGRTDALLDMSSISGEFNVLATSTRLASGLGAGPAEARGRSLAFVELGAPVGSVGDWAVRAAVAPGEVPAWIVQGEYQARHHRAHAFRTGATYARHAVESESVSYPGAAQNVSEFDLDRRVGGVYAFDHWTVRPGLVVDYGARFERYDYLVDPSLLSGWLGVHAAIAPRLTLVAQASPRMSAPGAAEFAPPQSATAWALPDRTFSALANGALRPERIGHYELGVDAELSEGTVVAVRRFRQSSRDQIATVFGQDDGAPAGRYYVATSGSVDVEGLSVGLDSRLWEHLRGRVVYTRTDGDWSATYARRRLSRVAPSLVRNGPEAGYDIVAALEAIVPGVDTRVNVAYRMSNLFADWSAGSGAGVTDGRFALEVRHRLPYRPLGQGEINVLASLRTLLHDEGSDGAFYDELMTLTPPLQVACGIQVRF